MSHVVDESKFDPWAPACTEYFRNYRDGRYHQESQFWFIFSLDNVSTNTETGALVIGAPGCDGIDFCFRAGFDGVWAFYPYDKEWVLLAATLADLERGWIDGSIKV
jgi:hypothetical protein